MFLAMMSNQERKHQIPAAMCLFESSMIKDVKSQNDRSNQIIGSKRYTPQKHVQLKTLNRGDGPASQVNKFRSHPSAELCLNTDAHYTYCGAEMVRIRCSSSDEHSIKTLLVWITSGICYWPLYIYNFVYFMFWSSNKNIHDMSKHPNSLT